MHELTGEILCNAIYAKELIIMPFLIVYSGGHGGGYGGHHYLALYKFMELGLT